MNTFFQTSEGAKEARKWLVVDATGIPVGRLASEVASLIRGKHRPEFTRHVDGGDFVIVINAAKIKFTGKKLQQKMYRRHTGYVGGLKEVPAEKLLANKPEEVITQAVQGMLPGGVLGHNLIKKLKVYKDSEHPHSAQMPEDYKLKYVSAN